MYLVENVRGDMREREREREREKEIPDTPLEQP